MDPLPPIERRGGEGNLTGEGFASAHRSVTGGQCSVVDSRTSMKMSSPTSLSLLLRSLYLCSGLRFSPSGVHLLAAKPENGDIRRLTVPKRPTKSQRTVKGSKWHAQTFRDGRSSHAPCFIPLKLLGQQKPVGASENVSVCDDSVTRREWVQHSRSEL